LGEKMAKATVLTVAVAFIVLGLLSLAYPAGGNGVNWIISGIVALLVAGSAERNSKSTRFFYLQGIFILLISLLYV